MAPRTVATQPFQSGALARTRWALDVAFALAEEGAAVAPSLAGEPQAASASASARTPSIAGSFMMMGSFSGAAVGRDRVL